VKEKNKEIPPAKHKALVDCHREGDEKKDKRHILTGSGSDRCSCGRLTTALTLCVKLPLYC